MIPEDLPQRLDVLRVLQSGNSRGRQLLKRFVGWCKQGDWGQGVERVEQPSKLQERDQRRIFFLFFENVGDCSLREKHGINHVHNAVGSQDVSAVNISNNAAAIINESEFVVVKVQVLNVRGVVIAIITLVISFIRVALTIVIGVFIRIATTKIIVITIVIITFADRLLKFVLLLHSKRFAAAQSHNLLSVSQRSGEHSARSNVVQQHGL